MASVIPFCVKESNNLKKKFSVVVNQEEYSVDGEQVFIKNYDDTQLKAERPNACYDLRVGDQYFNLQDKDITKTLLEDSAIFIKPGKTIIITTKEHFRFPDGLFGVIYPKVKMLEKGLANICSKIDPGFDGHLRITVFNLGANTIKLKPDEKFCSITLMNVDKDYGVIRYDKPLHSPVGQVKASLIQRVKNYYRHNPATLGPGIIGLAGLVVAILALFKP